MANYASVFSYVAELIDASVISNELIEKLIPAGEPLSSETALWDFKRSLPRLNDRPTDDERAEHKAEIADLMKDAVAFYNAYGGYLIFGVEDSGASRICGCNAEFDIGDFNNRIESATGRSIECLFERLTVRDRTGEHTISALLIPKRPDSLDPVSFKKAAPRHLNGKKAYEANDVYVRVRDQSRPATASSETWKFLHGPRLIEGTQRKRVTSARPMKVHLPARDPDLVRFIGREHYLGRLREWLTDRRSPVRLLTGIGGLGKTAIAYRFCEEVIETRAGEIEQLTWLTAKAVTYSALQGKLVEVSRTDFSDAISLYRSVLDALGYHPDWGDDEPSSADLVDAIVEALSVYTSLLVIDDIDSLSAEDQREVVHTLSSAVARTVTSDRHPSRILFTSRIDQGVSPASAIKVEGFEGAEFNAFIVEVAQALRVPLPEELDFEAFRKGTSGSPLFAASVLRLVRLGTSLQAALSRWQGQEGVEVRRFAFERELQELPTPASRLLYAVCLLGETTTLELSQVLEVSMRALESAVSNLQSFHLVVTRIDTGAGAMISAPDDVTLTKDILKTHLGRMAEDVERACANARSRTYLGAARISNTIAHVAALWRANKNSEALIEAERLHKEFPHNGDVTCLFANALIRPRIDRWQEADTKFLLAEKQKCSRPELIEGWLFAKERIEDWTGILSIANKTASNRRGEDRLLHAFVRATEELIAISKIRHDRARRISLSEQAVSYLTRHMNRNIYSAPDREFAWNKKLKFARLYIDDISAANSRGGDQIRIFDAVVKLFDQDVYLSEFLSRGLYALGLWWNDVERREYIDDGAKNIIKHSLSRADRMERLMRRLGKIELADQIQAQRLDLAHRAAGRL